MNLVYCKSKKLFYKKYLYKISINFLLGNIFRKYYQKGKTDLPFANNKIIEYRSKLKSSEKKYLELGHYRKIRIGNEHIRDAALIRRCLNNIEDYMIRQENLCNLQIYFNDIDTVLPMFKKLKTTEFLQIWQPDPAILNNTAPDILVSKLANEFSYKVTINFGALKRKNSSTIKWIENNRDKIRITDYSIQHAYSFVGVYVRDDKVLMLLQMTDNNFISRIERLILPS